MRVSDEERQRAIDELRRHCAAGRLDVDEYAERIERAMGATTVEELYAVMGDLPFMRIADPQGGRQPRSNGLVSSAPVSQDGGGKTGAAAVAGRLGASLTVIVSVVVVLVAVLLIAVASWAWAVVLIIGWLIGLAQGRLSGRSR